jgi:hypothetical protein
MVEQPDDPLTEEAIRHALHAGRVVPLAVSTPQARSTGSSCWPLSKGTPRIHTIHPPSAPGNEEDVFVAEVCVEVGRRPN